MTPESAPDPVPEPVNEVVLRGRVSADPEERVLPSGDRILIWRLVVRRPETRRASRMQVDTIDCTAWSSACRRAGARLRAGDQVEVRGSLRRHFRRGPTGAISRVDVEVDTVRRISRPVAPVSRSARADA